MPADFHTTRDLEETLGSLRATAAPLPPRQRWALLRADQQERWRRGDRLRVEAYLTAFPELHADADGLLDLIYAEVVLRQETGERPQMDEYLVRFPAQAEALRRQFLLDEALGESGFNVGVSDSAAVKEPETILYDALNSSLTAEDAEAPAAPAEPLPNVPGFEVLEQIGFGGMGVVYKARQLRPRRLVALKMIRAGAAANAEELRRFREEADTVAAFKHPHVVQIYEVGQWQPPGGTAVPYLVLEFLEGGSLSQKVRQAPLAARQAAAVVETVARTIHAAHQRGIVHRDLKPENILLAEDGTPKVADFGLAKRFDQQRSLTGDRILGTPAYMAPEQSLTVGTVGPPADVYGLGAILYELLVGRPPFRAATPLETLDLVRTREPVAPRTLQPELPRDLETICLKCLQKDPRRRYGSALELAEDLHHFLRDEPIVARPVGPLERLGRWAAKRPWVAGLGAAVLLLGLTVAVGSPIALVTIAAAHHEERLAKEHALRLAEDEKVARVRAEEAEQKALDAAAEQRAARARAEELQAQAQAEAERASRSAAALAGLFKASDPLGLNGYSFFTPRYTGEKLTAREMLDRGAQQVRLQLHDQPAALAQQLDTLGNVYRSLGLFAEARPLLTEALEIRRRLGREDLALAESLHNTGWLAHDLGDYDTAERLYREALALRSRLAGEDHLLTAASKFNLAWLLSQMGEAAEAEKLWREVIAVRKQRLGENHRDVGVALFGLAALLLDNDRNIEAAAYSLQAVEVFRKNEGQSEIVEAISAFQQGVALKNAGTPAWAEPRLQKSLALARKTMGENYPYVALVLHELADCQEQLGKLAEAEKTYRECLQVVRNSTGLEHPKAIVPVVHLARLLRKQKRAEEGERLFEEVETAVRNRYGDGHPLAAESLHYHAIYLDDDRRANTLHEKADAALRKGGLARSRLAAFHFNEWGEVKLRLQQRAAAEALFAEGLPLARQRFGEKHWLTEELRANLARASGVSQPR